MRQSWETMTSASAGHIILTPTQPVGSGRPQRGSNPGPPHQESRALPTELPRPPVKTHSESSGLYLNAKKTKIMDLDKSPTTTIDVDGEQLENVNNFVYLGSRIDADGKSSPDIRRRIAIAISKLNTMAPLWKSQSTELK